MTRQLLKGILPTDLLYSKQINYECHPYRIVFQRTSATSYFSYSLLTKVGGVRRCTQESRFREAVTFFYRISSVRLPYLVCNHTFVSICRLDVWWRNLVCFSRYSLSSLGKKIKIAVFFH